MPIDPPPVPPAALRAMDLQVFEQALRSRRFKQDYEADPLSVMRSQVPLTFQARRPYTPIFADVSEDVAPDAAQELGQLVLCGLLRDVSLSIRGTKNGVTISACLSVPDRDSGELAPLHLHDNLPLDHFHDIGAAQSVRMLLLRLYQHEVDEGIALLSDPATQRLVRPFDPHVWPR